MLTCKIIPAIGLMIVLSGCNASGENNVSQSDTTVQTKLTSKVTVSEKSSSQSTPAQKAVYDVQIVENGSVTASGIEIQKIATFDSSSQLYTLDINYSVTHNDGHVDENSYQSRMGVNQEEDNNMLVETCLGNHGASLEDVQTPAGTFRACKGNWGFQSDNLVSTIWVGKNARGYIVKEVKTYKTESGSISEIKTLKELN